MGLESDKVALPSEKPALLAVKSVAWASSPGKSGEVRSIVVELTVSGGEAVGS